ncbi:MAG: hypothetical protein KDI51_08830 [Xanthomonadales bacterium]|nr:hypothetical protein [Xanthomonadales bacterium]
MTSDLDPALDARRPVRNWPRLINVTGEVLYFLGLVGMPLIAIGVGVYGNLTSVPGANQTWKTVFPMLLGGFLLCLFGGWLRNLAYRLKKRRQPTHDH